MSYSVNYQTLMPYSKWYENIYNLKKHIEERCKEITEKYETKRKEYELESEKEYAKGEDLGCAFEQHNEPTLDNKEAQNKELISLESEIKSTLEKTLKNIVDELKLSTSPKKDYESYLTYYIRSIKEGKDIDMSNFTTEEGKIRKMNKNRNKSEHHEDSLLRIISSKDITDLSDTTFNYTNALIQKVYKKG